MSFLSSSYSRMINHRGHREEKTAKKKNRKGESAKSKVSRRQNQVIGCDAYLFALCFPLCPLWLLVLESRRALNFVSRINPRAGAASHVQEIRETLLLQNTGGRTRTIAARADDRRRFVQIKIQF